MLRQRQNEPGRVPVHSPRSLSTTVAVSRSPSSTFSTTCASISRVRNPKEKTRTTVHSLSARFAVASAFRAVFDQTSTVKWQNTQQR